MKKQLMTFLLCGSLFATAQQPVDYVNPSSVRAITVRRIPARFVRRV